MPKKTITKVKLEDIKLQTHDLRQRKDLGQLDELYASMNTIGQILPIIIDSDKTLICGHRRFECAKKLKWPTIDCVLEKDLKKNPVLAAKFQFDENERRKDLAWPERIEAIAKLKQLILIETPTLSQTKIAIKVGFTQGKLSRYLDIHEGLKKYPELAALDSMSNAHETMKRRTEEERNKNFEGARKIAIDNIVSTATATASAKPSAPAEPVGEKDSRYRNNKPRLL